MARAIDRRVLRTRARLRDALLALMAEQGYERTTIQNILDRADVGRTTFYAHFKSKDELLASSFDELRSFLRAQRSEAADRLLSFTTAMFEHADEHRRLYRALVGRRSGAMVQQRIRRVIAELVRDELSAASSDEELRVPLDALVEHVVGSFVGVLIWWLDHRTGLGPVEIDDVFRRLTLPVIAAAHDERGATRGRVSHRNSR